MSLHSDFFPEGGANDLIPGDVIDVPSNYIADNISYIDINDGVFIDKTLYPALSNNITSASNEFYIQGTNQVLKVK